MSEAPKQKGGMQAAEEAHLAERMLLVRHCHGDRSAFSELIALFRVRVYSYIVRCGVDASARDDVFQEIFTKVHTSARQYQPERPLEPWLFAIVANSVRTHFRRAPSHEVPAGNDPEGLIDLQPNAEAHTALNQTLEWFERAIQRLPFDQREVVTLCCLRDLSQKDVAKILDLPLNTVKTNLSRGRAALGRALARRNAALRREVSL